MDRLQANPRLMLGLGLLLLFLLSAGVTYGVLRPQSSAPENSSGETNQLSEEEKKKRINVLLLALDARPGEQTGRTDTMILASIDRQDKKIYLLSIPRDTRVRISGYGMDKINAAHMHGGVELAQKTVAELLGIPVDYYIKTDFNGFREIVDTLGGVEINVEKNMYHNEGDPEDLINLKKGVQKLEGKQALQYVRFRSDELGDISRTQRQQKFLQALAKEALQVNTVWKLPALVPQLAKAVETNLGIGEMISLATVAKEWKPENIISHTLPGNFMDMNGFSYWYVDPVKAKQAALDFMRGVISTEVIDGGTVVLVEKPKHKAATEGKVEEKKTLNPPLETKPATPTEKPTVPTEKPATLPTKPADPNIKPPTTPNAPASDDPQQKPGPETPKSNSPDNINTTNPLDTSNPNRIVPGAPPVPTGVQPTTGDTVKQPTDTKQPIDSGKSSSTQSKGQ